MGKMRSRRLKSSNKHINRVIQKDIENSTEVCKQRESLKENDNEKYTLKKSNSPQTRQ